MTAQKWGAKRESTRNSMVLHLDIFTYENNLNKIELGTSSMLSTIGFGVFLLLTICGL